MSAIDLHLAINQLPLHASLLACLFAAISFRQEWSRSARWASVVCLSVASVAASAAFFVGIEAHKLVADQAPIQAVQYHRLWATGAVGLVVFINSVLIGLTMRSVRHYVVVEFLLCMVASGVLLATQVAGKNLRAKMTESDHILNESHR